MSLKKGDGEGENGIDDQSYNGLFPKSPVREDRQENKKNRRTGWLVR